MFGQSASSLSLQDQLINLRQGKETVSDYTVQFRTLVAASGWNETALLFAYCQGLDPKIRIQMAIYDDTVGLESFMQKAIRISQCLTACQLDGLALPPASPSTLPPTPPAPEPMQMDAYRLTTTKHSQCLSTGL